MLSIIFEHLATNPQPPKKTQNKKPKKNPLLQKKKKSKRKQQKPFPSFTCDMWLPCTEGVACLLECVWDAILELQFSPPPFVGFFLTCQHPLGDQVAGSKACPSTTQRVLLLTWFLRDSPSSRVSLGIQCSTLFLCAFQHIEKDT